MHELPAQIREIRLFHRNHTYRPRGAADFGIDSERMHTRRTTRQLCRTIAKKHLRV